MTGTAYTAGRVSPEDRVKGTTSPAFSPAFDLAMREFSLNRFAPIRAYFGLLPGLSWAPCSSCLEIGFVAGPDSTCSRCALGLPLPGPSAAVLDDMARRHEATHA
jgi:hypothetical protein